MKPVLSNSRGMSLVETMVALAFTGAIALILMNLGEQQSKQQSRALLDSEQIEIYNLINRIIAKSDSCGATFVGLKPGDAFREIRYDFKDDQEAFATVRKKFRGGGKLIIASMEILKAGSTKASDGTPLYDIYPIDPNAGYLEDRDGDGFYEFPAKFKLDTPKASNIKVQDSLIMVEIVFQRPKAVSGPPNIIKYFEVPASIGVGEMLFKPSEGEVKTACYGSNPNKRIVDMDTYEDTLPGSTDEDDAILPHGGGLVMGLCVDRTQVGTQETYVLHCTTAKN